ncbi:MAG: outer membrane protein assembly factor BamE [Candidatus Thioglobus sp.]|nr:outer membrane protein assembly factor BamE [Candidatus Thioglobus sp.]
MKKITSIVCILPLLSACLPSMPELPDVSKIITEFSAPILYKDDVNQGSILERFKVNQIKVGMSKEQVKNLIGSPSIIDPFHNNQWDYINHSTLHKKADISYKLTLIFKNNNLIKIDRSGLKSLPALTDKEKKLQTQRLAEEKTTTAADTLEQKRLAAEIAKSKAMVKAKAERLAREKALKAGKK